MRVSGRRADPLASLAAAHAADAGQLLTGCLAPFAGATPLVISTSDTGVPILTHVVAACGFLSRLVGLSRMRRISCEEGLLFPRCGSVHCLGMRVPLCIVGLGPARLVGEGHLVALATVVWVVPCARPWSVPARAGATHVIEASCDSRAAGLEVGDELRISPAASMARRPVGEADR